MSIPPQLIRVKRKRDEEIPVTFLQFDKAKRHRSEGHWAYQRREVGPLSPSVPGKTSRDIEPIIHVSSPGSKASPTRKRTSTNATPSKGSGASAGASPTPPADSEAATEPRRFHISRKMMMPRSQSPSIGISKKIRYGPAVFVERSRTSLAHKASQSIDAAQKKQTSLAPKEQLENPEMIMDAPTEERKLKKPGITSRGRSPRPDMASRAPLPTSVMNPHVEEMNKIAADMNDWVLKEIGANLESMELERQSPRKFKPKAPAKRYSERHPESVPATKSPNIEMDMTMTDPSDDEDYVYEEYVRIPAHTMLPDVSPNEIGLLVLEGEEDSNLFYGPENDEDADLDEDEEDENAENYYTADYPEDEVESDDEYGRQSYGYRNGKASDDEEFDNVRDDLEDEMIIEGDDDDARMARLTHLMKRNRAFQS